MGREADVRHRADERQRTDTGRPVRNLLASHRQEMIAWSRGLMLELMELREVMGSGAMSDEI